MDLQQVRPLEHIHLLAGTCPMCDQVIPNDRLASVQARHAEHERELQGRFAKVAKDEQERLTRQFETDKAQALAKFQAEIVAREAAAREAERKATMAQVEGRMAESAMAAATAVERVAELQKQLEASAIETAAKLTSTREEAARQAHVELLPQLAAAQTAAKAADAEKASALEAKTAAEAQVAVLREGQEKALAERAQEMRSAFEKGNREALDAAASKHFEESQKVRNQLAEVTRQLENKTAQELGEGAEVDLFDSLRVAYPGDDISRVVKGAAGADIRHRVVHNGQLCGLILYDSKNHKAWRNEFVTKLRDDLLSDKADHAILSTIAFPQGSRQLHVQDSIVLVNPARAVVIAGIIRQHIVRSHSLRLSNEDREEKAIELYGYITSERFLGQLTKIQTSVEDLLELETKEQNVHKLTWAKRGSLLSAVAKAEADLRVSIDSVVGTAESLDAALAEAHRAGGMPAAS